MSETMIGHNSAIAAYDEFRAQIGELKTANAEMVFDYESPDGNKAARSQVHKLRGAKSAVEVVRKREKADSLEYGRRVDAQAKDIVSEIEEMIAVHAAPLQAIDDREKARVEGIMQTIAGMIAASQKDDPDGRPYDSATLDTSLGLVFAIVIDASYGEFEDQANETQANAIAALGRHIEAAKAREAEQEELARLRAESEARLKADSEESLRKEGEERVREEAETAAKVVADEAKAREANTKHRGKINLAAMTALIKGGVTQDMAKLAVKLIAQNKIPAVSISY